MASNEPKSTPEYGKLKNFWEASMYITSYIFNLNTNTFNEQRHQS